MALMAPIFNDRAPARAPRLTAHAVQRMAQRNLSQDDVQFVLRYGQQLHRAGALFVYLRGKDIPKPERRNTSISRLEGTAIVLSSDGEIVATVYRNRERGLSHIRRKSRNAFDTEADW
ncbi:MAG: DUF4258 domain-containing protein [Anaerolineae bacterium]